MFHVPSYGAKDLHERSYHGTDGLHVPLQPTDTGMMEEAKAKNPDSAKQMTGGLPMLTIDRVSTCSNTNITSGMSCRYCYHVWTRWSVAKSHVMIIRHVYLAYAPCTTLNHVTRCVRRGQL